MGGGLLANVASTAAGVAIGHTIGHAITGSMMGGGSNEPAAVEQQAAQPAAMQQHQPLAGQDPCKFELDQFLQCAKDSGDLSYCNGFNEVLRECKMRYSSQYH